MLEIKNSKQVHPNDRIRFRCMRCGECCRRVKGAVILESIDAYRLAKHLGINMTEVYEQYAEPFILKSGYPIFALKVKGDKQECVFLDGNRCSVRPARLRACRLYPFWVEPINEDGEMEYNYCSERKHHPNGSLIKVKDWMKDNLFPEDREYLAEEYRTVTKLAPLLHKARRIDVDATSIQKILLLYRYFLYETDQPFMEQFKHNNAELLRQMTCMIIRARNTGGES